MNVTVYVEMRSYSFVYAVILQLHSQVRRTCFRITWRCCIHQRNDADRTYLRFVRPGRGPGFVA